MTASLSARRAPARSLAYILAPSHSGSTLLAMLLAGHPEICTVGELTLSAVDNAETYLCSCGARLRECAFWARVSRRMAARGFAFEVWNAAADVRRLPSRWVRRALAPLHRGPLVERGRDLLLHCSPTWRATLPVLQAREAALADCVCEEYGARVIVDSSKIGVRLKYLLRNPGLDVRVVRLIRDGRAVATSHTDPATFADARDPARRGGGVGGSRDAERLSMAAAAHEWRRSHEEADAIVRSLDPEICCEVRYEALCSDPERTLAPVFALLGVDPDVPRAGFRRAGNHVVGNGMRLDAASEVELDTRWQQVFSDGDARAFEAVAGSLNRQFGYPT